VATKSDLDLAQQVRSFPSHLELAVAAPWIQPHAEPRIDVPLQRHEVQPDVYCRRLHLQVPLAVSVKTAQTADVFATICKIAMNPWVAYLECIWAFRLTLHSASSIPGAERGLSITARLWNLASMTALFSSVGVGVFLVYRALSLRPGGGGTGSFFGPILSWTVQFIGGRREL